MACSTGATGAGTALLPAAAERVNDFETPGCMNLVSKDLALWWCRSPV